MSRLTAMPMRPGTPPIDSGHEARRAFPRKTGPIVLDLSGRPADPQPLRRVRAMVIPVSVERGEIITLRGGQHRAVMQWALRDFRPMDASAQIQVGTLAAGRGWYVDHIGFGTRRFGDKHAAWTVTRQLMGLHEGHWEEVPVNRGPFLVVRRSDGSRVLYDQNDDECLYSYWGELKDRFWGRYTAAMNAGTKLRNTTTHKLFEGFITLSEYTDPTEGTTRYVLERAREGGGDYRVIDYPDRELAETRYEQSVRGNARRNYPYQSSDVDGVPVDSASADPPGIRRLPSGEIVATADLDEYEGLYGPVTDHHRGGQ